MIVGVKEVFCTCGTVMKRTGGTFGGDGPFTDTYYCKACTKHVIVVTPQQEEQEKFYKRIKVK